MESSKNNSEKIGRREFLKGAAAGGVLAASATTLGTKLGMKQVENENEMRPVLLVPTVNALKNAGATDADIANLVSIFGSKPLGFSRTF